VKKLLSLILFTICIYIGFILSLSIAITQKGFYSILVTSTIGDTHSFVLSKVNWHPVTPSVMLQDIKLENKRQKIVIQEVIVEFSLYKLLNKNFISRLNVSGVTIDNQNDTDQETDILGLLNFLSSIEELNIQELKLRFSDKAEFINLDLNSFYLNGGLNLKVSMKDGEGDVMEIGLLPYSDSIGSIFNGYIQADKFNVDPNIVRNFCNDCDFGFQLETSVLFNFFNEKPLSGKGNLDLTFDKNVLGINSLSSSFKLIDSDQISLQVSSFLNKDARLKVPDFLLFLTSSEEKIIIPEINLSEDLFLSHIIKNIDSSFNVALSGTLKNFILGLGEDFKKFNTTFNDLGIKQNSFSVDGLQGQFFINQEKGKLILHSPSAILVSENYFDEDINLNNFKSIVDFEITKNKFQISPSLFSLIVDGEQLEGLVKLYPIPTNGLGNIDIRIKGNSINNKLALTLMPNTPYLSGTKSAISSLITCGSIKDINLIFRLPVDGVYKNNSGSFGLQALGQNACLDINGYQIRDIDTSFEVNNFFFKGKLKEAKFLGSQISADYETYSESSGIVLAVRGESEGPFATFTNLLGDMLVDGEDIKGVHKTIFKYNTPLKRNISLLDNEASLEVITKIEKGNLNIEEYGLSIENLFSSLEYNSNVGFKEGFISLKFNSIPVLFDLDKNLSGSDYTIFRSDNSVNFSKLVPNNFKKRISGFSKSSFQLTIPSLIKGRNVKEAFIQVSSDLTGTKINLPSPLYKGVDDPLPLSFQYYPPINQNYSKLQFRYGDIFRGKFNIVDKSLQGFIIAGKKKQTISIGSKKISLIGTISELDLSLFSLLEFSGEGQIPSLEIKNLKIDKILLSNFSFPETLVSSLNSDKYLKLEIKNKNISGKVSIPRFKYLEPLIDLETINLSISGTGNSSFFLDIYNNLDRSLEFKTDSLILNSIDYGNWSFNIKPSKSTITLDNIRGSYGKWGLTNNGNDISRLKITREARGWKTHLESKIYSGSPEKGFLQLGIKPNFEMDTIFVETNISWLSLPWEFNYDSFNGEIYLDIQGLLIQNREDLQAQNNILRLVNIFNVTDSFEKVTNLDFRKLYKSGFSADSVKGKLKISTDSIILDSPMVFRSGSSEFKWQGKIGRDNSGDIDDLDLTVVMTLPLREYLPAYAFLLGGPITAGVVYIAGKAFERNLDQLSSGSWSVKGTLREPKTNFEGWFEE